VTLSKCTAQCGYSSEQPPSPSFERAVRVGQSDSQRGVETLVDQAREVSRVFLHTQFLQ